MPRRPTHYTGATAAITLLEAAQLGPRWALQPKVDGTFVRLALNSQGRVAHVFTRQGAELGRGLLAGILGARLGNPHAELVGELEAWTDAAARAVKTRRGRRLVHLFDCLHDGTRSLVRLPYAARRDSLWRQQSALECAGDDGWRVAPIVRQAPLSELDALWGEVVVEGDGEGLVAVNLDAPAGARASKRKIKPWEGLDCVVHEVGARHVTCLWNGHPFAAARGKVYCEPGNVVEVRHAGWYERGVMPKFPRLVRVRRDLLV